MASKRQLLELQGILNYRSQARAQGAPMVPSMRESFYSLPGLQDQLDMLEGMIELCEEIPGLAQRIQFGDEQQAA